MDSQQLREYFCSEPNTWFLKTDIEGFNDSILILLGIEDIPRIVKIDHKGHSIVKSEKTKWEENYDNYELDGLSSCLLSLENLIYDEKEKLSFVIWTFVSKHLAMNRRQFTGSYRWFYRTWRSKSIDSSFLSLLKKTAWIPISDRRFFKPEDIEIEQLLGNYVDSGELIDILGIRQETDQTSLFVEERKREQTSELGVAIEDIEFIKRNPEKFKQWKARTESRDGKPEFPIRTIADTERRQERLTEQIANAPEKEYEGRERSVRTTSGAIEPTLWLKEQYTNDTFQVICQICREEMPFRKRNGEYYFEAVETLSRDYFAKEHEAQYLALCPLCAAKYKEFIKHDEVAMADLRNTILTSSQLDIPLRFGDLDASIRFVETHWQDMRTILQAVI